MSRAVFFAVSLLCASSFADSYEERIYASVTDLKDELADIQEYDTSSLRASLQNIQNDIDDMLGKMGIAQQHAGYYRNKMNELDSYEYDALSYVLYNRPRYITKEREARRRYNDYERLYHTVSEKIDQLRGYLGYIGRPWATFPWLNAYFDMDLFEVVDDVFKVWYPRPYGNWVQKIDWKAYWFAQKRSREIGYSTGRIVYAPAVCDSSCDCRKVKNYPTDDMVKIRDALKLLFNGWNDFNRMNEIPD